MAVAITVTHPEYQAINLGNIMARLVTLTYSGTYTTGGDAFVAGTVGMSQIAAVLFMPRSDGAQTSAEVAAYDKTGGKIQLFGGAAATVKLAELANGTSLTNVVIDVLVLGQ